jgi:hypothetical protein
MVEVRFGSNGRAGDVRCTTALPPTAEVHPRSCYVAFVPEAVIPSLINTFSDERQNAALLYHQDRPAGRQPPRRRTGRTFHQSASQYVMSK